MSKNSKIVKTYTYHLGTKDYTIKNIKSLKSRVNHNIRKFQETNKNKSKDFEILKGSYDVVKDLKKIYKDEFDEAIKIYNSDKRKSRKITNYFNHVDNDGKLSLAEEVILQYGDLDFWQDKTFDKKEMNKVFEKQIKTFENLYPNFKIASAVVHYDEASPHCQIIGIPILEMSNQEIEDWKTENVNTTNAWNKANPDKRSKKPQALILTKRIGKGAVFNKDNLSYGQDVMRNDMLDSLHKITIYDKDGINVAPELDLLEKQEGRNYTSSVKNYKAVEDYKKTLDAESKVEVEKLKTALIDENAKELAHEKTLQQNKLNDDNVEVLKKLKEDQEKKLKAEQLKKEQEDKKNELLSSKNILLQQIQLNDLIDKTTNKVTEPPDEMFLIYNKNPNHNSLLSYSNSLVNLIDEKIKEHITDVFVIGVRNIIDASAKVLFKAFNNMISIANKVGDQLAEKNKELTEVITSVKNKNDELIKVKADYDSKNADLTKVTTAYDAKNTELASITKSIANKNGELNKMIDKGIGDILAGKRKKLIYGTELDEHINLLFEDLDKKIPYGNKILKISDYEFTFKYPEYVKQLSPLMEDINAALVALRDGESFEVEYSVDDIDKFEDYYDDSTR